MWLMKKLADALNVCTPFSELHFSSLAFETDLNFSFLKHFFELSPSEKS